MNLTIWECKKIWRRRSGKVALCFALVYALFTGCWNGFSNLAHKDGSNTITIIGTEEITQQYAWADAWKGPLTSEKLVAAKEQYDMADLPENQMTFEDGSTGPTNAAWNKFVRPLGDIPTILRDTYRLIPEYQSYYAFPTVPITLIEDYYSQREQIVTDYLTTQVADETDRAIFISQNEQVETPFAYDWIDGQKIYLQFFNSMAAFATLFLCIALAPLFAGEYQQKAASILLCAKLGRKKLAQAKLRAAMLIAAGTYLLCTSIYFICQLAFVGTRGLACPIQLIKPIATAPLTIGQAELFAFAIGLLGCLTITAFTVTLSAKMSSAFPVIIISFLVLFLPSMIGSSLPEWLQRGIDLLPFASDYGELFRTNLYHIFSLRIWSPYLLLLSPVVITCLCLPIAQHCYVKRQA